MDQTKNRRNCYLGVVGDPVDHSLSPAIHQQFAQQFSLGISYLKLKPDTDFDQLISDCQQQGYHGLNITAPFKQAAYQIANTLGPQAQIAQAVNTLTFKAGHIHGDNTDGEGLVRALTHHHHYQTQGSNLLILGAGGAARGILPALCHAQPRHITIANRTLSKAQKLCDIISDTIDTQACSLDQTILQNFDIIIDTTTDLASPPTLLDELNCSPSTLWYDLKYHHHPVWLQPWLDNNHCQFANGLSMLIEQAAISFAIWTGYEPDPFVVWQALNEL